jgi:uncharacterized membrane protein YhhN
MVGVPNTEFRCVAAQAVPRVLRIAAWLIGTGLAMVALTFALLANEKNAPLLFWFSVPIFFVAGRIFANGFSKRR